MQQGADDMIRRFGAVTRFCFWWLREYFEEVERITQYQHNQYMDQLRSLNARLAGQSRTIARLKQQVADMLAAKDWADTVKALRAASNTVEESKWTR